MSSYNSKISQLELNIESKIKSKQNLKVSMPTDSKEQNKFEKVKR
jgi:hypothetical protein